MINPVMVDSSNMLNITTKQGATVTIIKTLKTVEIICKTAPEMFEWQLQKVRDSIFEELHPQ